MRSVKHRAGISLLEVLISMFVLLIGLAGIAALLPAGKSEIMHGVRLDNAMMIGRNAFRDMEARGHLRARPSSGSAPFVDGWFEGGSIRVFRPDLDADQPWLLNGVQTAKPAVILDPIGVYAGYSNQFPSTTLVSGQPSLRRVTPLGDTASPAGRLLAETIYRVGDDPLTKINAVTKTGPPMRTLEPFNSTGTDIMRFARAGNYSFVSTVVCDQTITDPPTTPEIERIATVSVAVIHNRDLGSAALGSGERCWRVIAMPSMGMEGGDVLLFDPLSPITKPIRPGSWLMLAGSDSSGILRFHWYRVASANKVGAFDPSLLVMPGDTSAQFDRMQLVSLSGADWPVAPSMPPTTYAIAPSNGTNLNRPLSQGLPWPFVFIIDNVVGVYEQAIKLEP